MKKTALLFFILLTAIFIKNTFYENSIEEKSVRNLSNFIYAISPANDLVSPIVRNKIVPSISPSDAKIILPSIEKYRAEAKANPHHTPRVLIEFADQMAIELKRAQGSKLESEKVFEKMFQCANNSSTNALDPVRAICTVDALQVAKLYPEKLETRAHELVAQLPENVTDLVKAILDI